jgi:hypothetical protein
MCNTKFLLAPWMFKWSGERIEETKKIHNKNLSQTALNKQLSRIHLFPPLQQRRTIRATDCFTTSAMPSSSPKFVTNLQLKVKTLIRSWAQRLSYLLATIRLDLMEAKKLCDKSIFICFYMVIVTLQHCQQHLPYSNDSSSRMPTSDI